jgi:hypothetical protein
MKKVLLLLSILSLTGCFGYDIFFRESRVCTKYAIVANGGGCTEYMPFNRYYCEYRRPIPMVNLTKAICESEAECRKVCQENEAK